MNGYVGWIYFAIVGASVLLAATALLPLIRVEWWWIRIGDFPRAQLLVSYLVMLCCLLPFWGDVLATSLTGLLVVCTGIQLYWVFPYLPIASREVQASQAGVDASRLRIMTANVLQENENPRPLLDLVDQIRPDILALCEVNQRWASDLEPLKQQFQYHFIHPLENTYGLALFSKLAIEEL